VRARTAAILAAGAFLAWNALFDHVLVVFGDLYVVVARAAAASGAYAPIAGWMGPAKALGIRIASGITLAAVLCVVSAGFLGRMRSRRARASGPATAPPRA
jgi:hypothetical protein